jgi:hypothetical protein
VQLQEVILYEWLYIPWCARGGCASAPL